MKKKYLYIAVIIVLVIIALVAFWYFKLRNKSKFASDVNIEGDYVVEEGEKLILEGGAKLIVRGDLIVKGEIICEDGPLILEVSGIVLIENKLECDRGQELAENDPGLGISIVAEAGIETTASSQIITNGHVQIVNNKEDLAVTKKDYQELYEEASRDSGEGNRIGPFVSPKKATNPSLNIATRVSSKMLASLGSIFKTPVVHAAMLRLSGTLIVNTPPRGVNLIILWRIPNIEGIVFDDFTFIGPDGNDGKDGPIDCFSEGEDGQNAMRLLAYGSKIIVNKLTLNLGSGGNGGTGTTHMNGCMDAKAIGGDGGKSGDFKFIASEEFTINGPFVINPGKAGNAGDAFAYGKNGGPNEPGGKATATGGNPEDNKKAIRAKGTISGTDNIQIGSIIGGSGGSAYALGGHGGDGDPCSNKGARGGDAIAKAGKGGDALIYLTGTSASRIPGSEDIGGDAGVADALAGSGGKGAGCDCESQKTAGDGGDGGDAKITIQSGGIGSNPGNDGQDSEVKRHKGGDGGDGGDGYIPGGKGIRGAPDGKDGKMGKALDCDIAYVPDPIPDPNLDSMPDPIITDNIALTPQDVSFIHTMGYSPCPQFAGTISISNSGSGNVSGWRLNSPVPYWLDMPTSGSVPENISINFNCVLEEYIPQIVEAELKSQLYDATGNSVGEEITLNIVGEIK